MAAMSTRAGRWPPAGGTRNAIRSPTAPGRCRGAEVVVAESCGTEFVRKRAPRRCMGERRALAMSSQVLRCARHRYVMEFGHDNSAPTASARSCRRPNGVPCSASWWPSACSGRHRRPWRPPLGPDCRDVLRGERRVELGRRSHAAARPRPNAPPCGRPVKAWRRPPTSPSSSLRAKRMTLAKAQGVPPYVIFHDST